MGPGFESQRDHRKPPPTGRFFYFVTFNFYRYNFGGFKIGQKKEARDQKKKATQYNEQLTEQGMVAHPDF
jgi:hypothetical protein